MALIVLEYKNGEETFYGEFDTTEEVEEDLRENFEGDVEDLRVIEIETEYEVKKSFRLEEI